MQILESHNAEHKNSLAVARDGLHVLAKTRRTKTLYVLDAFPLIKKCAKILLAEKPCRRCNGQVKHDSKLTLVPTCYH